MSAKPDPDAAAKARSRAIVEQQYPHLVAFIDAARAALPTFGDQAKLTGVTIDGKPLRDWVAEQHERGDGV